MLDVLNYILEQSLVMIPVLIILGKMMKDSTLIPDKLIPVLLLPIGIIGGLFLTGFNIDGAIQGILVTGMAVYGNQLFKQLSNKGE